MMEYERAIEVLNGSFDIVRRGDDGPHLAANTLAALGIHEEPA